MIVYLATNKINGKRYVGVTTRQLATRICQHKNTAKKAKGAIGRAIRKYGICSFVWEVIHVAGSHDEMYKMEQFYIKKYNSVAPNGYNLSIGGESSALGVKHSQETRRKVSAAKSGKKIGPRPSEFCESIRRRRIKEAELGINCKIATSEIPNVIEMRSKGMSFARIASRYNCTPSAVFYSLRRERNG